MDTRTIKDVAKEMRAHERECVVYRQMTGQRLDAVEYRIKKTRGIAMVIKCIYYWIVDNYNTWSFIWKKLD